MMDNRYNWHPLYKYVCQVVEIFREGATFYSTNFEEMLNFISENCIYEEVKELLDVFKPLHITCYENFALFKYENFIELGDLGYNSSTEFFSIHNNLYRECRSVVFDVENLSIVLAPQSKFFNVNEIDEWSEQHIRQMINNAKTVEISNKIDGSNQNARYYNGEYVLAGSQALDSNESWRVTEGYKLLTDNYKKLLRDYPDYTFMFEYISPKNQVVVYYPKEMEGLYLFGMRNVYTGDELLYEDVLRIAKEYNVKTTEVYNDTFDDILNQLDNYKSSEKEGWVIRIVNEDMTTFKAKLKVNDYVLMHHAISALVSPNAVIEAVAENKYDDFYSKVPIGMRDIVNDYCRTLYEYKGLRWELAAYYKNLAFRNLGLDASMVDLMKWVTNNVPKVVAPDVRELIRNKNYEINYFVRHGSYYRYKEITELLLKYKALYEEVF